MKKTWRYAGNDAGRVLQEQGQCCHRISSPMSTGLLILFQTVLLPAVDASLGGARSVNVLERLSETRGLPEVITVDNGPEFVGKALDESGYRRVVRLNFIRPGIPLKMLLQKTLTTGYVMNA